MVGCQHTPVDGVISVLNTTKILQIHTNYLCFFLPSSSHPSSLQIQQWRVGCPLKLKPVDSILQPQVHLNNPVRNLYRKYTMAHESVLNVLHGCDTSNYEVDHCALEMLGNALEVKFTTSQSSFQNNPK